MQAKQFMWFLSWVAFQAVIHGSVMGVAGLLMGIESVPLFLAYSGAFAMLSSRPFIYAARKEYRRDFVQRQGVAALLVAVVMLLVALGHFVLYAYDGAGTSTAKTWTLFSGLLASGGGIGPLLTVDNALVIFAVVANFIAVVMLWTSSFFDGEILRKLYDFLGKFAVFRKMGFKRARRGRAKKANGELADDRLMHHWEALLQAGKLEVKKGDDGSMGGGIPLSQVDVSLDEDFKREKRMENGAEVAVMPSARETAMYKAGDAPPVIVKQLAAHALSFGSTRSGKGLTLIATLLAPEIEVDPTYGMSEIKRRFLRRTNSDYKRKTVYGGWRGGTLSIDPKGENVAVTLLARLKIPNRKVFVVDPFGILDVLSKKEGFEYLKKVRRAQVNFFDLVPMLDDEGALAPPEKLVGKRDVFDDESNVIGQEEYEFSCVDNSYVRDFGYDVQVKTKFGKMIQSLAGMLIPEEKDSSGAGKHFRTSALILLQGLIAWQCAVFPIGDSRRSLRFTADIMRNQRLLEAMLNGAHDKEGNELWPKECYENGELKAEWKDWDLSDPMWNERADGMVAQAKAKLVDQSGGENERPIIYGTLTVALSWLSLRAMRDHVSQSTFDMDEWFAGNIDLFVVIPPDLLASGMLMGYLRMWAGMPIMLAPDKQHIIKKRPGNRLLMILDEAARYGKLEAIATGYGLLAGYGLSIWMIWQDTNQFFEVYGKEAAENIIANAEFMNVLKVNKGDTTGAEKWSKAIGEETVELTSASKNAGQSGQIGGGSSSGTSTSQQFQKKEIISGGELQSFAPGDVVNLLEYADAERHAYRGRVVRYFGHPDYKPRMLPNPYQDGEPISPSMLAELEQLLDEMGEGKPFVPEEKSLIPEPFQGLPGDEEAEATTGELIDLDKIDVERTRGYKDRIAALKNGDRAAAAPTMVPATEMDESGLMEFMDDTELEDAY